MYVMKETKDSSGPLCVIMYTPASKCFNHFLRCACVRACVLVCLRARVCSRCCFSFYIVDIGLNVGINQPF